MIKCIFNQWLADGLWKLVKDPVQRSPHGTICWPQAFFNTKVCHLRLVIILAALQRGCMKAGKWSWTKSNRKRHWDILYKLCKLCNTLSLRERLQAVTRWVMDYTCLPLIWVTVNWLHRGSLICFSHMSLFLTVFTLFLCKESQIYLQHGYARRKVSAGIRSVCSQQDFGTRDILVQ